MLRELVKASDPTNAAAAALAAVRSIMVEAYNARVGVLE